MKKIALIAMAAIGMMCNAATIKVENPLDFERAGELAEVPLKNVKSQVKGDFVILDSNNKEVPYQITYDDLVVFPVTVGAKSSVVYTLKSGKPAPVKPVVHGRLFPEHKDNFSWENNRACFTAYGPALQDNGERGFGYDMWTKSVTDSLVLELRYKASIDPDKKKRQSLHKDYGNGGDPYIVANTLGGGTAALLDSKGDIIFPWCWKEQEVLQDGPLRFTVRLTYRPVTIEGEEGVVESRLITCDANSCLNRTEVSYKGLKEPRRVANGIVVHQQNPYAYSFDTAKQYIAYTDSTDNTKNGNGVIYIGAVVPEPVETICYKPVAEPARDALGHILTVSEYVPGKDYVYYWGSVWEKNPYAPANPSEWDLYLARYSDCLKNPLKVTVKK
ncbi:MAG: DUF4861 domain-containing protein [Bacteroides sp.]|nr:DUF4861 domain-containing protein [Bacteroides sp.]